MPDAAPRFTVLVPVDFSAPSRRAAAWAFEYAQRVPCDLHLVHVIDRHVSIAELRDPSADHLRAELDTIARATEEELRRTAPTDELRGLVGDIHHHVVMGAPAHEIVGLARRLGADLIVMGTHGHRNVVGRLFVGSVAQKVVREAPCTVVCAKPKLV